MSTGPSRTPMTTETSRNATAAPSQSGVKPRARTFARPEPASAGSGRAEIPEGVRFAAAMSLVLSLFLVLRAQPRECRGHRAEEVHEPRPPARGDGVIHADDGARPHGADAVPPWPPGDRGRALAAADDVREDDDVRVRSHDVLGRELRVARARGVGLVGDVLQPEEGVDLADEGLRGRREEV